MQPGFRVAENIYRQIWIVFLKQRFSYILQLFLFCENRSLVILRVYSYKIKQSELQLARDVFPRKQNHWNFFDLIYFPYRRRKT